MIRWVAAHKDLIRAIDVQPEQHSELLAGAVESLSDAELQHNARVLLIDKVPVGVVGIEVLWETAAWAWALFSVEARQHPVAVVRGIRKILREADRRGFQRVQATMSCSFPEARKLLKALGFEYEGTMRKFDPSGRDHDLYARIA